MLPGTAPMDPQMHQVAEHVGTSAPTTDQVFVTLPSSPL